MKNLATLCLLLGLLLSACSNKPDSASGVDHVFKNAKIWTGDTQQPWANWVAVQGGKIVALGAEDSKPPKAQQETDLQGQLLVPGFNDSHVHFSSAGALLLGINLLDVNDEAKFVERVKETTERLPKGSWITRGDWGAYEAWGVGSSGDKDKSNTVFTPNRSMIDDITPDHPVLVVRYDRTEGLANGLALKELGLESESGILEGEVLREALRQVPEKSFERRLAESRRALEECRKWGVTTVQDMSPLDQVDVYEHLYDKGDLTCRINFAPARLSEYENMIQKGWTVDWDGELAPHPTGGDWISFGTIKTHIDGIMGARSARFFQPYNDNIADQMDWRGGWREFSKDMPSFKEMLLAADKGDVQLRVHAIGDQANSILLDLLDTLDHFNGAKDRRFRLVHAQVISPGDFQRFQGRNIVAEVQPYHVTDDMRWMEERIGYERCKGAYDFKTSEDNGCILSFGSDWPGTDASYYPINPLMGLAHHVWRSPFRWKRPLFC